MSEGELKKRMQKHWTEMLAGDTGMENYPDSFNDILDEAKADFPDKGELTDGQFDSAVHEWFKKWFGGK
jgi:hypothetical protein